MQATVVSELLDSLKNSPASETLQQLQSVIGEASPDELKVLRRMLFAKPDESATGTDPDLGLPAGEKRHIRTKT